MAAAEPGENASNGLREIVTEAIRGCFDRFDEGDGPPEHVIADDVMLALTEPDDPIRRSEDAAVALFVIGRYRELLAEVERLRDERTLTLNMDHLAALMRLQEEIERLRDGIRRHNVLTMATIQRMAGDAAAQMDECSYHDGELWALLDEGDR